MENLTSEQLMVGNYVIEKDHGVSIVIEIHANTVVIDNPKCPGLVMVDYSDIKPIAVDVMVLACLGFEDLEMANPETPKMRGVFLKEKDEHVFCVIPHLDGYMHISTGKELEFVHEVQNLFYALHSVSLQNNELKASFLEGEKVGQGIIDALK